MNDKPIEAEVIPPQTQAVATRPEPGEVGKALGADEIKPPITAAQAKVDAVAALTMAAYQRAATLDLTPEEAAALQADFPDDAFQPGAAGKEHLIYIEHAHLRDRFNSVFGMGKWAIVPRNRWAEAFKTKNGVEGSRVYVEAMLVVRGCFVGEAVGAMEYYPKNESQNYGDAVEGAKTAAFRRCAKEFGVGLQAWKKEWCEGWWKRRRGGRDFGRKAPEPARPPSTATPPVKVPEKQVSHSNSATDKTRLWMIDQLKAGEGQPNAAIAQEYFVKVGQILETENIADLPLRFVPVSKAQLAALIEAIGDFEAGGDALAAFLPNPEPNQAPSPKPKAAVPAKPIEVPRDPPDPAGDSEAWRTFPMPWGKHAGVPLEELEKNYLFGLWANYQVEREFRGKPKKPETIAKDETFRAMLDLAGKHYEFKDPDDKNESQREGDPSEHGDSF